MSLRSYARWVLATDIGRSVAPDEPIPLARIARYSLYAVAIFAAGTLCAGFVASLVRLVGVSLYGVVTPLGRPVLDAVLPVRDGIRAFALLVAVGVFLTQFER
ncbi:hypothetical protein NDI56_03550 [Haloarcula sp. S1CR25-12]|uniref:Uncharacterized protein n=1 Tax=Haloarcula saliterrae TaxID=2950534 RepID=A0ABU2F8A8_9EURY|nr:hypothetical protein [Haloarcula sp. S1CR25-12]MDS0258484.1 hypothetical protein [Haloarcula sp. S1CR25-12]